MKVRVRKSESLRFRSKREDWKEVEHPIKTYDVSSHYTLMHEVLNNMEQRGFELDSCIMTFVERSSKNDSHLVHVFTDVIP